MSLQLRDASHSSHSRSPAASYTTKHVRIRWTIDTCHGIAGPSGRLSACDLSERFVKVRNSGRGFHSSLDNVLKYPRIADSITLWQRFAKGFVCGLVKVKRKFFPL